jgi:hypothetical protein
MRKTARRLAGLAAVGVAGVLLAACYTGNPAGPGVVIGGDSITAISTPDLQAQLNPYYQTDIQANYGYTWAEESPAVNNAIAQDSPAPSAVIVNLGTNDAIQAGLGNPTDWIDPMNAFIAASVSVPCVIFVTINDRLGEFFDPQSQATADAINARIYELHAADPSHYAYIDWNSLVRANPDWLQADGIHPNATGQEELATWYSIALYGITPTSTSCP